MRKTGYSRLYLSTLLPVSLLWVLPEQEACSCLGTEAYPCLYPHFLLYCMFSWMFCWNQHFKCGRDSTDGQGFLCPLYFSNTIFFFKTWLKPLQPWGTQCPFRLPIPTALNTSHLELLLLLSPVWLPALETQRIDLIAFPVFEDRAFVFKDFLL